MARGIPARPYLAIVVRSNRILSMEGLREALRAAGYPVPSKNIALASQARVLREDFGWGFRKRGSLPAVYYAPDVTKEELEAYCTAHISPRGAYDTKPLEAFTRAIAWSYAVARTLPDWKRSADEQKV